MNLKKLASNDLIVVRLNGQVVTENVCPDREVGTSLAFYTDLGLWTIASKFPKHRAPELVSQDPYPEEKSWESRQTYRPRRY